MLFLLKIRLLPMGKTITRKKRTRRGNKPYKPWYKKKYSAMEIAGKAWNTAKFLKKLINVEVKKFDTTNSAVSTSSGTVTILSGVAQGDAVNNRNGNSIRAKYLTGTIKFQQNASATVPTLLRYSVVMDRQHTSDTNPQYTDCYDDADPLAPIEKNTAGRFEILYTELFTLQPVGEASNECHVINFSIPLDTHIRFNGTAAGDHEHNALYAMVSDDEATNHPTMDFYYRLGFIDN